MDINQSYLKSVLHYDPDTGVFTWRERPRSMFSCDRIHASWNATWSGKTAGGATGYGYITVKVLNKGYQAHRLAFLYMTGSFPPDQTDHVNGERNDNRWENLRAVTNSENGKNQKRRCTNTSGVMGVYWNTSCKRWQSYIKVNGHYKYIGVFANKDAAIAARKEAEQQYSFHCNHGR